MFSADASRNRSDIFKKFGAAELTLRYRKKYGLGEDVEFDHVRRHAALEGKLTDDLLESTPDNRAAVFASAYSRLYAELPWLVGTGTREGGEQWATLMRAGSSVYEIGSGAGYLVNYLASRGFNCYGTDIATERERAATSNVLGVTWGRTDGVNLTRFAKANSFDYVISDQVVEHLHPDDIETHFNEARLLLKEGGSYIVRTPYAPNGPSDLSTVFGATQPLFMHLHEFDFDEINYIKVHCRYQRAKAVLRQTRLRVMIKSEAYMRYLSLFDRIAKANLSRDAWASIVKAVGRYLLIPRGVWVVFER